MPGQFNVSHNPGQNLRATATTAGIAGMLNIARSITVTLTTAPADAAINASSGISTVVLRDGPSDTGTILWQAAISVTSMPGNAASPIVLTSQNFEGTSGQPMTLEFTNAAGMGTFEVVAFSGDIRSNA